MLDEIGLPLSPKMEALLPQEWRDLASDSALATIVLASYLESLSVEYGMSELYEEEFVERACRPALAVPLVAPYLFEADGTADPDHIRSAVYSALANLRRPGRADPSQGLWSDTFTKDRITRVGQVFWAISHDGDYRSRLPYKHGEIGRSPVAAEGLVDLVPIIWVPEKKIDLASLERSRRAGAVSKLGFTSGQRLLEAGARLSLLVAAQLVFGYPPTASCVQTIRRRLERADAVGMIRAASAGESHPSESRDPLVAVLRSQRKQAAKVDSLDTVLEASMAILAILKLRASTVDGDHEAQIADELIRVGVGARDVGRGADSIIALSDAARTCRALVDREPREQSHQVRLAATLILLGQFELELGNTEQAKPHLSEAVTRAEDLRDQNLQNEDLLAMALIALGTSELVDVGQTQVSRSLVRGANIAQKLVEQHPQGTTLGGLAAAALIALGLSQMAMDELGLAQTSLLDAVQIGERALNSGATDFATRLVAPTALALLGAVRILDDDFLLGEEALRSAVHDFRALLADVSEQGAHSAGSNRSRQVAPIFALSLTFLALLCVGTERVEEAALLLDEARRESPRDGSAGILSGYELMTQDLSELVEQELAAARDETET